MSKISFSPVVFCTPDRIRIDGEEDVLQCLYAFFIGIFIQFMHISDEGLLLALSIIVLIKRGLRQKVISDIVVRPQTVLRTDAAVYECRHLLVEFI